MHGAHVGGDVVGGEDGRVPDGPDGGHVDVEAAEGVVGGTVPDAEDDADAGEGGEGGGGAGGGGGADEAEGRGGVFGDCFQDGGGDGVEE